MSIITERQKEILEAVIKEHIKMALPISSDFLKEACGFECSSATIRLDFNELTKDGFLRQSHISGGRIPTDKGYRFFVDRLFEEGDLAVKEKKILEIFNSILSKVKNILRISQEVAHALSFLSDNLCFVWIEDYDVFLKEGWEEVVMAPEFKNIDYFKKFTEFVNDFEENLKGLSFNKGERIRIYIGQESPFKNKEFSIILGQPLNSVKAQERPTFAILGPRRMDFRRNIALLNSAIETLENY